MGAKLFIGTPWMRNEGVLKKIWFGLCEIAWFLWQPIANLRVQDRLYLNLSPRLKVFLRDFPSFL